MTLDAAHIGYLTSQSRGRLATVGPDGTPQNKPVGYRYNTDLCAIRALTQEAAENHLVDAHLASAVGKVKGVKSAGTRTGNWLAHTQAQALLDAPDSATLKGVRDQAILAVLLGCGSRRGELAALTFGHLQQHEGRWAGTTRLQRARLGI